MTAATVSRWARRYVIVSALFLVVWQGGALVGFPQRTEVLLGIFGFVLHMVFGKAYSLIPTYFDRQLTVARAPMVQFPLTVVGTGCLVGESRGIGPNWIGTVGAILWGVGVAVFLGALLWTIRDNLTGRESATGESNADRRPIDRLANGFVPVALGYLAFGSYETIAIYTGLPALFDGYFPRVSHLLAAGTAAMLIFALGFRLLPRFLVASPPKALVTVILPAGAFGPALLAGYLGGGRWFQLGAVTQATAVVGYALTYSILFARSDRRRVGFYGVLAGAGSGVFGVALGLSFAFGHSTSSLVLTHFRLNVLGFLGLTIIGVAYQFYPPAVGALRGASDRTALGSIGSLTGGLLLQVVGLIGQLASILQVGEVLTFIGAMMYAYVIVAVFHAR
ncbi:hypothetical protein [Halomarina pelagica]|uniref:hypothetical protein n=1 Tax=Halomarina pelagica TaxID=2961599 RepID=UPI0020C3721A|nr:hypothetical protein [Halomarina sp. BND7]